MNNPFPPLVDVSEVLAHPEWVLLDLRTDEFEDGHPAGAIVTDYTAPDLWRRTEHAAPGLLPEAASLSALFGDLGVAPEDTVILVSSSSNASDLAAAARVFWTFKVAGHEKIAILNGGWPEWLDQNAPVETGLPASRAKTVYPVTLRKDFWSSVEDVEAALEKGSHFPLDARPLPFYKGLAKAGSARRAGRLPGAGQVDYADLFDSSRRRLKSQAELEPLFADVPDKPVISYCNTGHTAALNWFVLSQILKREHVTLFDGSMTQWTEEDSRPVEAG